jgi:H+-translocating NAD(P) transhydrogenase subunit alpha
VKALEWIAQLIVFLAVYNLGHIVWWNVRKRYFVHPVILELAIAILLVTFIWIPFGTWWQVILVAASVGGLKGDLEARRSEQKRQNGFT